jgi:peptide/nickel transport system substrate-binding protein
MRKNLTMILTSTPKQALRWLATLLLATSTLLAVSVRTMEANGQRDSGAKPHSGGTIVTRLIFPPDCLNPLKSLTAGAGVDSAIFDTLLSSDDYGRVRPNLALRWTLSHNGTRVTLVLRQGVHFSNGDLLTASSVKYTLEQALKSPVTAPGLGPLVSVQTIGTFAVRLILSSPFRPLLDNLRFGPFIVDPRAANNQSESSCQNPIGSGPFKIQSVGPGFSTVTAVRNPYRNWNPSWMHNRGRAYLSGIVFEPIVSDTTAVSALESGDVDITRVPTSETSRVQGNPNIRLHRAYEPGEEYLGFNTSHPPFDQVAVRRAVAESIDRAALIKVALDGLGEPAYSPVAATLPYYDMRAKDYAPRHDVRAARRILAANHVTGPYTLVTYPIPAFSVAAEFIQAELAQVGVQTNIVLKPIPDAQALMRQGQYDLSIDIMLGNDLYQRFHSSQLPGRGGFNVSFYQSAKLDKLIVQSRTTIDRKKATKVFDELQRFMDKTVIVDPLFTRLLVAGARSRIGGWHVSQGSSTALFPVWQDLYISE